ncbi:MAG: hypothetical protein PWP24_1981 [Clostridiales bacterium]|nr:hypothetical protein [Clostridiales bacterium]
MKKEKEIMMSMFKSKMFYISIAMLLLLFVLDAFSIELGVTKTDLGASLGLSALHSAFFQFVSMLKIVPPIFLMIGLLDIWVPRETMIRLMGEKSGIIGVLIALFIGTMSAGPLVAAFPVAQIMLKKGAKYSNVLFFLCVWASAKLPILFFQATELGIKYTVVTNLVLLLVYLIGTIIIERLLTKEEKSKIYAIAEKA